MDLRRLRAGDWIAALGGVTLLLSLFLPWYDHGTPSGELLRSGGGRGGWDAWASFAVIDVALALVALAAIGLWLATSTQRVPALPIAWAALLVLVGLLALLLVLFRVAFEPGLPGDVAPVPRGLEVDTTREVGLWLGLVSVVAIIAGAALSMRDERLGTPDRPRDASGRPTSSTEEVELRPAPPR
jgi:hypothetical protein